MSYLYPRQPTIKNGRIMAMKHNNYAFIDSQNLNLGVQGMGWRLDFAKFRVYLRQRFRVKKAFIFIGYIESNKRLYEFLENAGYILVYKPTIESKGETKGNVDAELVLHAAAIEYDNYDQAVIVSGDGDFRCLIEFLIERKKLRRMIVPNIHKYSSLLTEFEKDITFLNGTRNKLERKRK